MDADPTGLTCDEVVLLIEALDAFIPRRGNGSWMGGERFTPEQEERYSPYEMLRERLKGHAVLGFFDQARGWLPKVMREERIAFSQDLLRRFNALLEEPGLTRRSLRAGVVAALQELREVQHHEMPNAQGF